MYEYALMNYPNLNNGGIEKFNDDRFGRAGSTSATKVSPQITGCTTAPCSCG